MPILHVPFDADLHEAAFVKKGKRSWEAYIRGLVAQDVAGATARRQAPTVSVPAANAEPVAPGLSDARGHIPPAPGQRTADEILAEANEQDAKRR